MSKNYYSLGLMSGTSMDGVDASIIYSNGTSKYKAISNKYFVYNKDFYQDLTSLRDKINSSKDLKKLSNDLKSIEKEITLFHAKVANELIRESNIDIDFIGFHGQTIFHNADEKISRQLGDGKLLSQLTKKTVVYDFRQNDLKNGGQGAPLTPIFHQMLEKKFNIKPVSFINIGGIINRTTIWDDGYLSATDIGPGMCLIDKWIRINTKKKYDVSGAIAKSGKINKIILDQSLENFFNNQSYAIYDKNSAKFIKSFDINDFDVSFVRGLSLEDGAATLTEYTVRIILPDLYFSQGQKEKVVLCGGGRKNDFLIDRLKQNNIPIKFIEDYGVDGDFVESQAFAYLAIRSYLNLPISFPGTTNAKKPCNGGVIVTNY